jgi:hypothetical protein
MKKVGLAILVVLALVVVVLLKPSDDTNIKYLANVYNAKGTKVAKITNSKSVDLISNLVGEAGDGIVKKKKLPDNAKVNYHYVLIEHKKHSTHKINFYVYSNVNYIRVNYLPILIKSVYHLPEKDAQLLNHPQELK